MYDGPQTSPVNQSILDEYWSALQMTTAELDGALSARAGRELKENPFLLDTDGHREWARGFIRQRTKARA